MRVGEWKKALADGALDNRLRSLYGCTATHRLMDLLCEFEQQFDPAASVSIFSAPGRVELCGNHTDHQGGCVVALAVDLDILGVAAPVSQPVIRLYSAGHRPCVVDLTKPCPPKGSSPAMVYGVVKALEQKGYRVGGFCCVTHSLVPTGSGLSSSAAFENLVATVISHLYNQGSVSPLEKALAGQWAENNCYGKPCGLMDQLASCLGNVSFMDFAYPQAPTYETLSMPLDALDRVLCVVKTGGSHGKLTHLYAAIPREMRSVAAFFGQEVLSQITQDQVMTHLSGLREKTGDRAVMRALHYFGEVARCHQLRSCLKEGDPQNLLSLLESSGISSQCLLQNVSNPEDPAFDGVGIALCVSRELCPAGTFRVHGGGFGGTMLGLVPTGEWDTYQAKMEELFGKGSCVALRVRTVGGIKIQ